MVPKKSRRFTTLVYGEPNETPPEAFHAVFLEPGRGNMGNPRRSAFRRPINRGFDRRFSHDSPRFMGLRAEIIAKNTAKGAIFRCFLLYKRKALPYDRIDWKGSKHFRIVLFYEIPRYGTGDMRSPLRKSNQDHRRLRWLKSND